MKNFLKIYWKILAFFAGMGLVSGFCVGLYALESYPADMQQQILSQGMTPQLLAVVSAIQAALYGIVLGALGILMAKKVGLWRDESHFERKPLTAAALVSVIGGAAMILLDVFWFGNYSQPVRDS